MQTPVAATGDRIATQRIALETHEFGHCLVAMLHSHPGRGRGANHASGTDLRTQKLMEFTTRVVGGIWARDGNLRFYSDKLAFDVEIIGNHLEHQDDGTWQLAAELAAANELDVRNTPRTHRGL